METCSPQTIGVGPSDQADWDPRPLGEASAGPYTRSMWRAIVRMYSSDLAMAMGVILALQLVGLLGMFQVLQSFS